MILVLEVVKTTVWLFLTVVETAMFIRAIMSWFVMDSNRFLDFLYAITEPFVFPVRWLFEKMNWFQGLPIDLSFMTSFLLISGLTFLLSP